MLSHLQICMVIALLLIWMFLIVMKGDNHGNVQVQDAERAPGMGSRSSQDAGWEKGSGQDEEKAPGQIQILARIHSGSAPRGAYRASCTVPTDPSQILVRS